MRTLVLTEYFLPTLGGSINWLVNTYSRYDPHEVLCVAPQVASETVRDACLPFQVRRIPLTLTDWDPLTWASFTRYLGILWRVAVIRQRHQSEQIHCAKVFPEGLVAYCLQRYQAIPYIVYAHGEEISSSLTSRKLAWMLPKIYQRAAAIIANSHNTKRLLESVGVAAEKIHLIHPGVDIQAFHQAGNGALQLRQRYGLGDDPVILTVGRLQRRKGHDMVIKALPLLHQRFPRAKYLIVGRGEERAALQQLVEHLQLTTSVIFAGAVPDNELPSHYAVCDVFVMPNRQIGADIEGFGMVYLEAGAAGKPVIGGISGGTEDAIIDQCTGLRIDGTSVLQITAALNALLSEPERAQAMGACGRRRVETEFTWEVIVERTRRVADLVARAASVTAPLRSA